MPRSGSVVMLRYKTASGPAALIRTPQLGNKRLLFGADVAYGNGKTIGVVALGSRIFARGLENKGSLFVKWGGRLRRSSAGLIMCCPRKRVTQGHAHMSVEGHCIGSGQARSADLAAGGAATTQQ